MNRNGKTGILVLTIVFGSVWMAQMGDNQEIFWIGRGDADPYWNRCADELPVRAFETVYDAVALVLTGEKARILVINAVIIGPGLKAETKTLLSSGYFDAIYLYSIAPRIPHYTPNGDARVVWVNHPDELFERLRSFQPIAPTEVVEPEKTVVAPVSISASEPAPIPVLPEPVWPLQPPAGAVEKKIETPEAEKDVKKVAPDNGTDISSRESAGEKAGENGKRTEPAFHAAELTSEELQALLGSEFKTEKEP